MTLKELSEKLEIPRSAALKLVRLLPGTKKEAAGPGQIPKWVIPDDALDQVTEEMLEEAREPTTTTEKTTTGKDESGSPTRVTTLGALPTDPALHEEELAVKRERLAAEKIRAETARLQAEADRRKVQEELKALGTARPGADPLLAERLARIEAALQRPDATATVVELVKAVTPVLTPLLERATTPAPHPPATPPLGPTDLLALAERLKGLTSPEGTLRNEIRAAFREGMEIGRERAAAGAEGGGDWAETVRGVMQGLSLALPDLAQAARQVGLVRPGIQPGAMQEALPNPGGEGGPPVAMNPAIKGLFDALVTELSKPQEARDLPGVAAFLDSVTWDASGATLFDRVVSIARSPEALARASLKLLDPRLVEGAAWEGMKKLLPHVKEEAEKGGETQ